MNTTLLVIVGLCTCMEFVQAFEPPVDKEQISKAFNIPLTEIKLTVKTDEVARKHGNSVYSASLFEFESDSNVSLQVIVTKGHFLLNDAVRIRLEGEFELVNKVDLENGGIAFIGIEGFGPGAEGYVAIAHLPSENLDFRLRVIVSNDGVSAGDVSQESFTRSSPLLLKALRMLAISSAAFLSGNPNSSSEPMKEGTQLMEPSGGIANNVQGENKAFRNEDFDHEYPALNAKTWKSRSLALTGICFLLIVFFWISRKKFNKNRSVTRNEKKIKKNNKISICCYYCFGYMFGCSRCMSI